MTTNSEEVSADAQRPGLSTLNMPRSRRSGNSRDHARATIHHWISNLMPATLRTPRKAVTLSNHGRPPQHRLVYGRSGYSKAEMCAVASNMQGFTGLLAAKCRKAAWTYCILVGQDIYPDRQVREIKHHSQTIKIPDPIGCAVYSRTTLTKLSYYI